MAAAIQIFTKKLARQSHLGSSEHLVESKSDGIDSLKPEDINCRGCRSESGHFLGCEKCIIRSCCQEKNLVTCFRKGIRWLYKIE